MKIDNHPRGPSTVVAVTGRHHLRGERRVPHQVHRHLPLATPRRDRTDSIGTDQRPQHPRRVQQARLAWSGGNKYVTATVRSAAKSGILVNVSALTIGRCYWRAAGKKAPHNLVVNPAVRAGGGSIGRSCPRTVDLRRCLRSTRRRGRGFAVRMDGVDITWMWDAPSGQYLRQQGGRAHVAIDGAQIAATNVVIMSVTYIPSLADPRSPEAQTLGAGQVVVHRNGVAVAGTWTRATPHRPVPLHRRRQPRRSRSPVEHVRRTRPSLSSAAR